MDCSFSWHQQECLNLVDIQIRLLNQLISMWACCLRFFDDLHQAQICLPRKLMRRPTSLLWNALLISWAVIVVWLYGLGEYWYPSRRVEYHGEIAALEFCRLSSALINQHGTNCTFLTMILSIAGAPVSKNMYQWTFSIYVTLPCFSAVGMRWTMYVADIYMQLRTFFSACIGILMW